MTVTKLDLRRSLRELYAPPRDPVLVAVPPLTCLMVDGKGDPNIVASYREAVEALYAVSYGAKFALKHAGGPDIAVMPLEALWWVTDMAGFAASDRAQWLWTALIVQPEPVTSVVVDEARAKVRSRRPVPPAIDLVRREVLEEGSAAQVMHVGPYADEGPVIERLHRFVEESGMRLRGKHHEIYLTDPRRTSPGRMRTVLRQPVEPA